MLHSEERLFLESGPWSQYDLDVVVPFFNEERSIEASHHSARRLERLFHIKNYVYVDNGSLDATAAALEREARSDPKIRVVRVPRNLGYGYGMCQGFTAATAEFILTNHADQQFDAYTFFMTHLDRLQTLTRPVPVFPRRVDRPRVDSFFSCVLRLMLCGMLGRRISDFNGQPKLLLRAPIMQVISGLPHDFCLDLALYLLFAEQDLLKLPIIQANRRHGESSWNTKFGARATMAGSYLRYVVGPGRRWLSRSQ